MSDKINMTISIPTDDEGYLLLKCGHCSTFFKVTPYDLKDDRILFIFCPSCGLVSDNYFTDDVLKLARTMGENKAMDMAYDKLKDLERSSRNGMFRIKLKSHRHRENEDPIRSGIEALEVCMFPCCARSVKIKPLLKITGAYCPFCGVKNYEIE